MGEAIEENKILAEFLGYKYYPLGNEEKHPAGWYLPRTHPKSGLHFIGRNHNNLVFHSDWNALMRVIDKIESLTDLFHGHFQVFLHGNSCTIQASTLETRPEKKQVHSYFNQVSEYKDKKLSTWYACYLFAAWWKEYSKKE